MRTFLGRLWQFLTWLLAMLVGYLTFYDIVRRMIEHGQEVEAQRARMGTREGGS